jgi:DNA repair exonuclease SbcCD nuclease subunit
MDAQISKLVRNLQRAISAHTPTAIFVLGDIIHGGGSPQRYYEVARAIESTGVECHIIPGNHDLIRFRPVVAGWHGQRVAVHMSDLIIIKSDNGTRDVVLGHDLGQCKTIRGERTKKWFRQLRTVYKDSIPPGSLFVVGHVHELHSSDDKLSWSIPRFAVDEEEFHFGLLRRNRNGVIELTVSTFPN